MIRRRKVGNHRPIVARDDDRTPPSRLLLLDTVLCEHALLDACVRKLLAERILTNASNVDDRFGGEHVLGAAGRVLGSTPGEILGGVLFCRDFLVDWEVGRIGQDCVVGL